MSGNSYGEILKEFKDSESPDGIFSLMHDSKLGDGFSAWKAAKITFKKITTDPPDEERNRWDWLWDQVDVDYRAFGVVAGSKSQMAQDLFERLKGLRLIYPDGTVNSMAKSYINQIIMKQISVKTPKIPKK